MPYISQLLDNKVYDSSDAVVGKLQDILIKPKNGTFSPLEFLAVAKSGEKRTVFIPYEAVENFTSSDISLKNLYEKIPPANPVPQDYIYLKRDVLDRQIVDVAGTRVVRVNDLRIGNFENRMCVLGIDASVRGFLRRLGLGGLPFFNLLKVQLIDWRQAQLLEKGPLQLNTAVESLGHLHPADLANIVEELDVKRGSKLLTTLDAAEAAKVLEEVDPQLQNILVKYLGPERAGKILSQMSSDEFTDLVKTFSTGEAQEFLSQVSGGRAQNVQKLIAYPDNTAGGLMTLDYAGSRPEWTVEQAVSELRKISPSVRSIAHIYVTGENGRFIGAVSLRRLLLADGNSTMAKMAKDFPVYSTLKPQDKLRKIVRLMTKYNLYTAAVLDKDKRLLGVVTIDDVMRLLAPTA